MTSTAAARDCRQEPGIFIPVIDRNRCEGKEACVEVCPYDVFEMGRLTDDDKLSMTFGGRIKAWAHRNRQAFAIRSDQCHACGLCVAACPEKAIKLMRA